MYVLITYDVSTTTPAGKSRLRRTAKTCLDFGQRVQNSVFECKVDPAQLVALKTHLLDIIDPKTDSLRFYHLGSNWHHKVEHHGANDGYDVDGTLVVRRKRAQDSTVNQAIGQLPREPQAIS